MFGVNYMTKWHRYSPVYSTDEVLHRDFAFFEGQGLKILELRIMWHKLEGDTQGDYDGERGPGDPYGEPFLDNIKRVLAIAQQYNFIIVLSVNCDWDGGWNVPDYVIDAVTGENRGLAIWSSDAMANAFIDAFEHAVQYMAGQPFYAWSYLNEPYGFTTDPQFERAIYVAQECHDKVKTNDPLKKTTMNFLAIQLYLNPSSKYVLYDLFNRLWKYDSRLFASVDYVGFSLFVDKFRAVTEWETGFSYEVFKTMTRELFSKIGTFNKEIWIDQCGVDNDDDTIQATEFGEDIEFLSSLPVSSIVAWMWVSDQDNPADWGYPGVGYNCCKDTDGNPRPAFYEMLNFSLELPEESVYLYPGEAIPEDIRLRTEVIELGWIVDFK